MPSHLEIQTKRASLETVKLIITLKCSETFRYCTTLDNILLVNISTTKSISLILI